MDNSQKIIIAAVDAYNKKRQEAFKILVKHGLPKNSTNKQALEFLFERLDNCPEFYDEYMNFLVKYDFIQVSEKRNFAIAALLPILSSAMPLLGKIGEGKKIEGQQEIEQQQTQQEMIRLMQVQADADAKKKQTQTIIAVVIIIAVFSMVGIILYKN